MNTYPNYYALLAAARTDMQRAAALDEWLPAQPEEIRQAVEYKLFLLTDAGLTEMEAKVLLSMLVVFLNCPPDERDAMVRHGETVRAAQEWEQIETRRRVRQMESIGV